MHILVIPSWYPKCPGDIQGSFFREQFLALKNYGHKVGVIDVKLRLPRTWRALFDGFFGTNSDDDEGLYTYHVCGVDWFRKVPVLQRWLWLHHGEKLIEKYIAKYGAPDLIHAHAIFNAGLLAKAISDKYDIPFVITEHNSGYARGHIDQKQLDAAKAVSASASRCFAVGGELCTVLKQKVGGQDVVWDEMPNLVEKRFLDEALIPSNETNGTFIFLNVSLLTEVKGIHNLISAFAQAFRGDSKVVLKIGGDGEERSRLESLAKKLGVAERVMFLGMLTREEVLKEMTQMDVLVVSSSYETFGVVIVEALALGKPVIATRCGGPDAIVREQDGLLVPPNDVNALAEAMKKIKSNSASYNPEEIRASCLARYSDSVIASRLTSAYLEILRDRVCEGI